MRDVRYDQGPEPEAAPTGSRAAATWGLAVRIVAVLVAVILGLGLLYVLQALVLQVIVAITIASGLGPLVDRLERRRLSRGLAVLAIYVAAAIAIVVVGLITIPPIVRQVQDTIQNLPAYSDALTQKLTSLGLPGASGLQAQLGNAVKGLTGQGGGGQGGGVPVGAAGQGIAALSAGLGALGGIFALGLILTIAIIFTTDARKIRDYGLSFLPLDRRPRVQAVSDRMVRRMGDWFVSQVILSAIAGVATFVVLLVIGFGFSNAVLFGFLAALGQVVPMIGPIVVAIPAVIVGFFIGPVQGIATAAYYLAFVEVENVYLMPRLFGDALHLHPLTVLFALIAGGAILGVPGTIVAIPVVAALAALLDEYRNVPGQEPEKEVGKEPGREPAPRLVR